MKKFKAVVAMMIVCLLATFSVFAQGGTESKSSGTEAPTKLVVVLRTFGTVPTDIDLVSQEISKITKEKINAEVQLMIIPSGSYTQQITLMLTGNEQVDCLGVTRAVFTSAYNSDQLLPLDDLLAKYGKGITDAIDAEYLKVGRFDGKQYGITTNRDQARGYGGWLLRTDLLKKYNIDASKITTYADLTNAFEVIHKNEPNMTIVSPGSAGNSFFQWCVGFDNLNDYFGVLPNFGQDLKVENLFTSKDYLDYLAVVRDWYLKGYISKDIISQTESGLTLMKSGNLFAYCNSGKPGIESQEELSSGTDLTYVQVQETFTSTAAPLTFEWTIPITSANPEKAMQFMNLMYSNADIMNLMAYGIEGKHWVEKGDGTITYPSGVTARNSGYNLNQTWSLGNEFIAKIWEGNDPDLWKQTEAWNKTGKFSKAMGFLYDNTNVKNEVSAVQNVYNQYRMSLECGLVDYNKVIPEMVDKMNAAGLQKIIDEKQKQLDAWAKLNGIK